MVQIINLLLERENTGSNADLLQYLAWKGSARRLKINSSQVNIFMIRELRELFPGSNFILTMRHPLEWLRSMLDDSLRQETSDHWHRFRDFRFGSKENLPNEEAALAEAGLYSLTGYLTYSRTAIILSRLNIGQDPILILRTEDLLRRSKEVAEFCGIDWFVPEESKAHAYVNPTRFGLLKKIDQEYLVEKTEEICGDLLREFYPERDTRQLLEELNARDR